MADDRLPFRADENALIKLGDAGSAPILNYNVPQPAEYTGRNYIELEVDGDIWSAAARKRPAKEQDDSTSGGSSSVGRSTRDDREDRLREELLPIDPDDLPERFPGGPGRGPGGGAGPDPLPPLAELRMRAREAVMGHDATSSRGGNARDKKLPQRIDGVNIEEGGDVVFLDYQSNSGQGMRAPSRSFYDEKLDALVLREGPRSFVKKLQDGLPIVTRKTINGEVKAEFGAKPSEKSTPRIALIESVRMSSFLGDYGAGRTISTFSLLPGERHEISIKTYKRTKQTATEASSILDSYESSTADEFMDDLSTENSAKDSEESNFSYHAKAQASAGWGWGSASVSGGVAGGSSSAREEFAKNVSNTTQKHAAKAASKRQVEVNTSTETETEESEERVISRTIENINVSRTLNFVFRQMNQKFVTVLYLTDVRIGFHNGDPSTWREVPLPELEGFLKEMVKPSERAALRHAIHDALYYTFDWQGDHRPLVEERVLTPDGAAKPPIIAAALNSSPYKYWRYCRHTTQLDRNADGVEASIPGVVLGVTSSTLPTDGVIVESLLGQGNALDAYSLGLQVEAVRERLAQNDRTQTETSILNEKMKVAADGDEDQAALLIALFPTEADEELDNG